jgi:Phage integrase family
MSCGRITAGCVEQQINVPVVITRAAVAAVLSLMDGTAQLLAKLLYGSGLHIMEAVRLRVKDIDDQMKPLTVRSGKGDKDRFTTFPATSDAVAPEPPGRGQDAASAGPGAGGMARSTCPMRWLASRRIAATPGAGRMSSPPGMSP